MEKKIVNDKGFSLIELLVCLAISAFVILAAYSLVMVGTKNYDSTNKTTTLQQEMTFTNNLVGESIRSADISKTAIYKMADGVELYTGSKVIVYSDVRKALYVFEYDSTKTYGSYNNFTNDYLVSKYITSFNVDYVATEVGSDPVAVVGTPLIATAGGTNLVKVTQKVEVKGKSDISEVIYEIRNK